jgi:flagellar biosynthesis/type III secretory pathway M-ring protein FliF/YscJ
MIGAMDKVHKILTHPAVIVAGTLLLAILALWSQNPDSNPLYRFWR